MRLLNIVRRSKHVYSLVALSLGSFLIGLLLKSASQGKSAFYSKITDSATMSQTCITEPSLVTSETVKQMAIPDRPTISGLETWLRPDAGEMCLVLILHSWVCSSVQKLTLDCYLIATYSSFRPCTGEHPRGLVR